MAKSKQPVTITIKQLSETEYDLIAVSKGRRPLDAHLRREKRLPSQVWLLDVFKSGVPTKAAHVGTFDDAGYGDTPDWNSVFNVLTDHLKQAYGKTTPRNR